MKKQRLKELSALLPAMVILLTALAEQAVGEEAPKVRPTSEQRTVADIDDPWLRSGKIGQSLIGSVVVRGDTYWFLVGI